MKFLRSLIYILFLTVTVIPFAILCMLWSPLSLAWRYRLTRGWPTLATWGAKVICNIDYRVEGRENLPDSAAILLVKHQSAWETIWLPSAMPRVLTFVYKRQLHWVPFFGWGLALLKMINIDRRKGQDAFEQVVEQGTDRLARGWYIVMFPEGTRTPPGSTRRYKTGGARLAVRTGALAVPIAVNSGEFWPRNAFIKQPGTITVVICKPIDPRGKSVEEVAAQVEFAIETEMRRIAPHRYSGPYQSGSNAERNASSLESRPA